MDNQQPPLPEQVNDDLQRTMMDIQRFPAFMSDFYDRKIKGTDNLTRTESLEERRKTWEINKSEADKLLNR